MKRLKKSGEIVVLGAGKWTPVRLAIANAIHHAELHPGFKVTLVSDHPELKHDLAEIGISYRPVPQLPEMDLPCGGGTIYEGRSKFFALKILCIKETVDADVAALIDSDAAGMVPFGDLFGTLAPRKHFALARDRYQTLEEARRRPRKPLATAEEWDALEAELGDLSTIPSFNTGFVMFRPGAFVSSICDQWVESWRRFRGSDQQDLSRLYATKPALRSALQEIDGKYNFFLDWRSMRPAPGEKKSRAEVLLEQGRAVIIHGHDAATDVFRSTGAWHHAQLLMKRAGFVKP